MPKKLNRIKVEEKLKSMGLIVFTPREFEGVFGVPRATAAYYIASNLESGLFVKLRNNFYMLKDSHPSMYTIANKLYQPSYISLEMALSYYGFIPEVVYGMTSITTKPTREFVTPRGVFSYQRIKKVAFTGYRFAEVENTRALMAEPEKALADYLYFVDLKKISLNDRITIKTVRKSQLMRYVKLFQRPGMKKLVEKIYDQQRKPREIR